MAEVNRDNFNKLLADVELGQLDFEDVPVLSPPPEAPLQETMTRDEYFQQRQQEFMEKWADLQLRITKDSSFNPTMMLCVLVDESTGVSSDVNIGMTREEYIFWLEEARHYFWKRRGNAE